MEVFDLPIGKRRGVAITFLPGMVRSLMSGTSALTMLRSVGLGYRTQVFYRDWAEAITKVGFEGRLERLPPGVKPPYWWAAKTPVHLSEKYHAVIEATMKHRVTGVEKTFEFRMARGELATREDILEEARGHPAITKQSEYEGLVGLKWVSLEARE